MARDNKTMSLGAIRQSGDGQCDEALRSNSAKCLRTIRGVVEEQLGKVGGGNGGMRCGAVCNSTATCYSGAKTS